uniref:Novel immune-type receptor 12 n=1 Tax=Paramormyrops kingsleyae TaxID=1676925 RepID=A0A3B3RTV8_9TELE
MAYYLFNLLSWTISSNNFLSFFPSVVNLVLLTQAEHMKTFHLGDTVTLHCSISSVDSTYFYWFKQAVGESPQSIMSVYSYNMELVFYGEFQGDQRFAVHKNSTNMSLTISNAKPMDSGFYFCCTREYERIIFWNNFFLKYEEELNTTLTFHPGDSVTLQCTIETESCAGEHGVYWFKHGSGESLPGVIYTHGNRSDKCKKSSEAGSPTQSCVYSLPKRNLSLSDAGTYYCAVAMCGEILFGNGTKLNIKGDLFYFDNYSSMQKFGHPSINYIFWSFFYGKDVKTVSVGNGKNAQYFHQTLMHSYFLCHKLNKEFYSFIFSIKK